MIEGVLFSFVIGAITDKQFHTVADQRDEFVRKNYELQAKHTALVDGLQELPRYRGVDGALVLYSADVAALLGDEE